MLLHAELCSADHLHIDVMVQSWSIDMFLQRTTARVLPRMRCSSGVNTKACMLFVATSFVCTSTQQWRKFYLLELLQHAGGLHGDVREGVIVHTCILNCPNLLENWNLQTYL